MQHIHRGLLVNREFRFFFFIYYQHYVKIIFTHFWLVQWSRIKIRILCSPINWLRICLIFNYLSILEYFFSPWKTFLIMWTHWLFFFSSPMRELSNPGASGSIFYLTYDDEFILKTVQVIYFFRNFTKTLFLVIFTKICK